MGFSLVAVVLAVFIGTGCTAPVCGTGLLEVDRRCVEEVVEVVEPKCSEVCDAEAHEICNTSLEQPACTCAPGYEGNPCSWVGVLKDTGFADVQSWSFTNGGTVLPDEPAPQDTGVAYLRASVVCNGGAVSQTVEMPPYEAAEPLVAEVTYRAEDVYGAAVGYNRAWRMLPPTGPAAGGPSGEWATRRICLGEAAYGGSVRFQVASGDQTPACFTAPVGEIEVDRLAIVPALADECPAVGAVLNGQAEEDLGGWEFAPTDTLPPTPVQVGFDATAGRSNSSGAGIYYPEDSSGAGVMLTKLSVPLTSTLASPALRYWWKGTTGSRFHAEIGTYVEGEIRRAVEDFEGNSSDNNPVYCLPPWTHGNVVELAFWIFREGSQPEELVVDDVEIVSDPSCGDFTALFDPGFESAPNRTMGATTATTLLETPQSVEMKKEAGLAQNGEGVLELAAWSADSLILYETWVFVPRSDGDSGPAFIYRYNFPDIVGGVELPVQSVLGRAAVEPRDLTAGGGWKSEHMCLPPKWSDRWFRVQFRVGKLFDAPPAAPLDPPVRIYLDDFEVTTRSACPTD